MKNTLNAYTSSANSYLFNSIRAAALAGLGLVACGGVQAQAQASPYMGELRAFAFDFCPKGWAPAANQTMAINTNQALFSILGATYGGNGQTTFGLPDLQGRAPLGAGPLHNEGVNTGPNYTLGQKYGTETATLQATHLPAHTHPQIATTDPATRATPAAGDLLARTQNAGLYAGYSNTTLATNPTGNGHPIPVRNPYLAITWCVAMTGVFPSHN